MKKQDKKDKKDKKDKVFIADDGFHFTNIKFNLHFTKQNQKKIQIDYKNMIVVIDWINNGQIHKINLGHLLQTENDQEQSNQSLNFETIKTHEFGVIKIDENYLKLLTQNSFYVYLVNSENNELIEKMIMNYSDLLLMNNQNKVEKIEEDQEFIYQKHYSVSNVSLEIEQIKISIETDNLLISNENMKKYNPLVVDIVKLMNIPRKAFENVEPIQIEIDFYQLCKIRSQQYKHQKDININLVHVFLLELMERSKKDQLIKSIQEQDLVVTLYDKNYISDQVYNEHQNFNFEEYRQKLQEEEQQLIQQQQQQQNQDKNKKNDKKPDQKDKKNDKKNDKKDVLQNIEIKETPCSSEVQVDCYGETRFNCKGILNKNSNNYKFKLNIQPIIKKKEFGDDRKLDLQSIKDNQKMNNKYERMGEYFENDTQIKLKVYFVFKQTQFYIRKENEQQLEQDLNEEQQLDRMKEKMAEQLEKEKKQMNNEKNKKNNKKEIQKDEQEIEDTQQDTELIKPYERMILVLPYQDFDMFHRIEDYINNVNLQCLKKLKHRLDLKQQHLVMHELSSSEKEDHSLNYINGLQIMDSKVRIYFLEGLQEMNVFEKIGKMIPHHTINEEYKYLRNRNVVFSERIYQFNLSIKRIKLFKNIDRILLKADYYQRSQFVQEFKNIFSVFKVIFESENMRYLNDNGHFPVMDDILKMEKYLSKKLDKRDLYGQTFDDKPELMNKDSLMMDNNDELVLDQILDGYNDEVRESQLFSKSTIQMEYGSDNNRSVHNSLILPSIYGRQSKTQTNRERIEKYNDQDGPVYMYGGQRLNNYELQLRRLRNESDVDHDHHYTFSHDYLTQSLSKDIHQSGIQEQQQSMSLMKGGQFRIGCRTQIEKNKIFKQLQIDQTPYHIAKKQSQIYQQRYDDQHIGDHEWDIYFGKKQKHIYKRQKDTKYEPNYVHNYRDQKTQRMKDLQTHSVNQSQNSVLDKYRSILKDQPSTQGLAISQLRLKRNQHSQWNKYVQNSPISMFIDHQWVEQKNMFQKSIDQQKHEEKFRFRNMDSTKPLEYKPKIVYRPTK